MQMRLRWIERVFSRVELTKEKVEPSESKVESTKVKDICNQI